MMAARWRSRQGPRCWRIWLSSTPHGVKYLFPDMGLADRPWGKSGRSLLLASCPYEILSRPSFQLPENSLSSRTAKSVPRLGGGSRILE